MRECLPARMDSSRTPTQSTPTRTAPMDRHAEHTCSSMYARTHMHTPPLSLIPFPFLISLFTRQSFYLFVCLLFAYTRTGKGTGHLKKENAKRNKLCFLLFWKTTKVSRKRRRKKVLFITWIILDILYVIATNY